MNDVVLVSHSAFFTLMLKCLPVYREKLKQRLKASFKCFQRPSFIEEALGYMRFICRAVR